MKTPQQIIPTPASHEENTFVRLVCSVALMTLASASLFPGPTCVLDRVVRHTRTGAARSGSGGTRQNALLADQYITPDKPGSPRMQIATPGGVDRGTAEGQAGQPQPAAAHGSSARPTLVAPQPGAYALLPDFLFRHLRPLASLGSRGPPTL